MSKNSVLCNLHIKACFGQQENPLKEIQMIIYLIICDSLILGDLCYFAQFAEHKFSDFTWKLNCLQI